MLEYAIGMIAFLNNPLIIFDEGDKLTDSVFNYFISTASLGLDDQGAARGRHTARRAETAA